MAGPPLLQQRPFRMLTISRFISRVAQNALNAALVLLVVDETGLAVMSSLLVVALVVPSTAAGIVAGAAADHLPKRALVLIGNLARAGICVLFVQGPEGTAMFYVIAVLLACAAQFATNAEGAIQPAIVSRAELAKANAISQAVSSAAQLVGLAILTPVALRLLDAPDLLFLLCAALFVVAGIYALFVGQVRKVAAEVVGGEPSGHWWAAGWHALRATPQIYQAALELTLISCALITLGGLIPAYIREVLGLPVDIGAVILVPAAVGIALGLRVSSVLAHRVPHGLLSSVGFAGFVGGLLLLAFANPAADFLGGYSAFSWINDVDIGKFDGGGALAMVAMFPAGFCFALVNVAGQTVLNDRIPLHLQGRAGSTQAAVTALVSAVPVVAAGALADAVGVSAVMAVVGLLLAAAAVTVSRANRRAAPREAWGNRRFD